MPFWISSSSFEISDISVTADKISQGLVVSSLGLVSATVDGDWELLFGRRSATIVKVVAAFEQGLNVGV